MDHPQIIKGDLIKEKSQLAQTSNAKTHMPLPLPFMK